uniref:Uncharacterized protein n=2 Tax=Nicotiana TaxID=4085 RepID=A0A1S3YZI0_TOBAC|nr:PREDICTED: uncharacterized protein LOC104221898 [Nicotiana sylvestris]XP_016457731.1 PREDICTED: uncharacterized protein LOC107781528 [Nicotiana tabacum]
MASLSPDNSFANYDKDRIMKPATLYPHEFSSSKIEDLSYELDNYILFVNEDNDFSNLKGLGDLSETLVETDLYKTWRLIFLLVKLSLMLLVAIAMVEIAFSSMKYIKNDLRRGIGTTTGYYSAVKSPETPSTVAPGTALHLNRYRRDRVTTGR